MFYKLAGLATQLRELKKRFQNMDTSKEDPAKVRELRDLIKDLEEDLTKKKEQKEERRKKKEEVSNEVEKEAAPETKIDKDPAVYVPESLKEKERIVEKVEKDPKIAPHLISFKLDDEVIPVRGNSNSWGIVMRSDFDQEKSPNGLVYVSWQDGDLKTRDVFGGYYGADLQPRVKKDAVSTDYVPREQVYNLEADLKSNYEQSIKNLEEEKQMAQEKGEYAWVGRLEEKINDLRKAYDERFPKVAENGSGGSDKLKVVDFTPAHDKDPQEKATGYGGDRPMGAMVAPNSDENSLPLESSKKCKECTGPEVNCACPCHKQASLNKDAFNVTIAEKLFTVKPLGHDTLEGTYNYDVALANGNKLFKITAKGELGQEDFSTIIQKELGNNKEAKNKCAICNLEFNTWAEYDTHKKEGHKPKMDPAKKQEIVERVEQKTPGIIGKLTSDLAFLKKGSLVSILSEDKAKNQIKFAALDNSIRGWAPSTKFAAYDTPKTNLVPHEDHKDEVLAESGNELLVSCPSGSSNVTWRTIEAPPATPESLNPDVTAAKEEHRHYQCQTCPKIFNTYEELKEHEKLPPPEKEASLKIESHIRHEDGKWVIYSHDYKKKLGTYDSKEAAEKRLKQIEYFKHQGSLQPLSKKESAQFDSHGNERGLNDLYVLPDSPEEAAKLESYLKQNGRSYQWFVSDVEGQPWYGKRVLEIPFGETLRPEIEKLIVSTASQKKADLEPSQISLEQHVQGFRDRMQAISDRLATPPAKTADLETTQDLSNVDAKDLSSGIAHMIDMLESKVGEDVSSNPEAHKLLEELENKLWEAELALGIKPELPEHEKAEPEHSSVVKEIEQKEEPVEKESAKKCPGCGKEIWDYSGGGMTGAKLNKCWNCGLAFDDAEEDIEVESAKGAPLSLFNAQTAQSVVDKLKTEVQAPYVNAHPSTLGGEQNVSILLTISADPKESWSNGILENSRYGKFHINNDGEIEQHSGGFYHYNEPKIPGFRKRNVKNVDQLIQVLNDYLSKLSTAQTPTVKESEIKTEADAVNTPPTTLPPTGFKYAWDPKNNQWILVQVEGATGGY